MVRPWVVTTVACRFGVVLLVPMSDVLLDLAAAAEAVLLICGV